MRTICLWLVLTVGWSCNEAPPDRLPTTYAALQGETMGTTYNVTYRSDRSSVDKAEFDSLLVAINAEVSTYEPESTISRFNRSASATFDTEGAVHFLENYMAARQVFTASGGTFDPTIAPLVNYWGFGYTPKRPVLRVDSVRVDSLLQLVGFDRMSLDQTTIRRDRPEMQLDFSAIAKGYGVDQLGLYLEDRGIVNYLVEIGGEVRARGVNKSGQAWRIGINVPAEDAALTDFDNVVLLRGQSMATSGNYRNYYEVDGSKYSHTINPRSGFPERSRLLSTSIVAERCMYADAYATACMVMGTERALAFIESLDGIEGYFISADEQGAFTASQTSNFPVANPPN